MIAVDPRSEMLFEMGQCAYRLGKGFAEAAERAEGHAEKLEYFQLFDRCFFAARMSVALELRLRREARADGRAQALDRETGEHEAADPIERDPPETERFTESETEREREREPVSLPVLLATLNGVAADASALPGPEPAALPTLRELLARVKADAAPAARPPPGAKLRARLAGSATAPAFAFASPPHPSGRRGGSSLRRATGPPR